MMKCGSRTTMGHGEVAICGEQYYGDIYQCMGCRVKDLEEEVDRLRAKSPEVGLLTSALLDLSALYTELNGGQWPGWYVHKHSAVIDYTRSLDVEACKEACRQIECERSGKCLKYQTEPQSSEDK